MVGMLLAGSKGAFVALPALTVFTVIYLYVGKAISVYRFIYIYFNDRFDNG